MNNSSILRWTRPAIRALAPYQVPESLGLVKLDAMENPYPWPQELVDAWLRTLRSVALNRYPDAEARGLKCRLREYLRLPPEAEIVLGNGSDELIQMIGLTVTGPGRTLLTPEPGFAMYRIIAEIAELNYVSVPLRPADFSLDIPAMRVAIDRHQPAILILGYPNNPSGNLFDRTSVEHLIQASPGLVVIDEAYFDFTGATFIPEIRRYPDVLVLRTLSKIGLAGLRLGILLGRRAWLSEINKIRLPYNINVLSQVSGEFMLGHAEVLEPQVKQIVADREALYGDLRELMGVQVWPSQTNFLLMRLTGRARQVFQRLKEKKILIKNLDGVHPLLKDCLRVTVGTPEENALFYETLKSLLDPK
jgi:histidinol-phosphate aminotransferase